MKRVNVALIEKKVCEWRSKMLSIFKDAGIYEENSKENSKENSSIGDWVRNTQLDFSKDELLQSKDDYSFVINALDLKGTNFKNGCLDKKFNVKYYDVEVTETDDILTITIYGGMIKNGREKNNT